MAQQRRMLYAKLLTSHNINVLPVATRYLYVGMLVLADDDGRLNADPRYVKGAVFSYDEEITAKDVEHMLGDLHAAGVLELYEVEGARYAEHPKWKEYQNIRRDMYTPSKIPSSRATKAEPLQPRNEPDTKAVHKLSKVKLSKVKSSKDNTGKVLPVRPDDPGIIEKEKYGEHQNVRLTPEEYLKLVDRWGNDAVRDNIEQLSGYMASKGKRYKDHYATINNWIRRKQEETRGKGKSFTVIG